MDLFAGLDLKLNELRNIVIHPLAADPGSPSEGQFWLNTTTHRLKAHLGGVTVTLAELEDSLSAFAVPTADLDLNTHKLINVVDPAAAQDAATKAYVDAAVAGAGGGRNPDTTFECFDDFTNAIDMSPFVNVWHSELQWSRSGSDAEYPDFSDASFIGAVRIHSPAGGQEAMYLGPVPAGTNYLTRLDDKTFDFKFRFKFLDAADKIIYNMALGDGAIQFSVNTISIYFDQNNSPNIHYLTSDGAGSTYTDSGIVADTNPHVGRIRSTTPGEILFSIDGGVETMINTHVPSARIFPSFGVGTYGTTTVDHSLLLDYIWLKITGLTR